MKKNEDLLFGIGNIDPELVTEALPKRKNTVKITKLCALVATIALMVSSLTVYLLMPYSDHLARYSESDYYEVIKALDKLESTPVFKNRFDKLSSMALSALASFAPKGGNNIDMDAAPPTSDRGDGAGDYVETTDNQTAGVIEADLFKRTSTHVFYLYGSSVLSYSIEKDLSELKCSYDLDLPSDMKYKLGGTAEMYLSEDAKTLTVIYPYVTDENKYAVSVMMLDVENPEEIKARQRATFGGSYLSSRLVGDRLLVFTSFAFDNVDYRDPETFVPTVTVGSETVCVSPDSIVIPEKMGAKRYTVVSVLDESTADLVGTLALLSYAETVYVSDSSVYAVGTPFRDSRGSFTDITRIDYLSDSLSENMTYTVRGRVLNQYSLDEYEGVLRVVTSTDSSASLYCMDKENGNMIGKVESFAPSGEEVTSVRFDGESAYVCTAVRVTFTDPVFFFDLSDYSDISYTGTGYIDGFSSSLINYGDILLGIGEDDSTTLKVEIYAEIEGAVVPLDSYKLVGEASEIYKSYFVDREGMLFGFGAQLFTPSALEAPYRYVLLSIRDGELYELVNIPVFSGVDMMRAFLDDGWLYVLGASDFRAVRVGK